MMPGNTKYIEQIPAYNPDNTVNTELNNYLLQQKRKEMHDILNRKFEEYVDNWGKHIRIKY